jgi:3-oxoacyl-[acyl-carrier-protein] synthase-3
MDNPVFRWAVWEMARVAEQALAAAGVSAADLDAFIPRRPTCASPTQW